MQAIFQILLSQFNKLLPQLPTLFPKFLDWLTNKFLNAKQKELLKDAQPLTNENDNFILVQCLKKGVHTYRGKYDELINADWVSGIVHFKGHEIDFMSGYWGKGSAPKGEYLAKNYRVENGEAYSLFGIGFFIDIIPKFQTDRTELGIHFDGGDGSDGKKGFEGTLGCIGLKARNVDEAVKIRNIFRDAFDNGKEYDLRVI